MWNPNIYQPPGTYWEELTSPVAAPNLPEKPLTIIGEVPANVSVTESIAMCCVATELTYSVVDESSIILTSLDGLTTYVKNTDYVVLSADATYNTRLKIWADPPTGVNCTASATGGSLSADTYYYVVTAVSSNGLETTGTLTGNSCNATISATGGRIDLSWNAVSGAASYNIYRGTSTTIPTLLTSVTAPTTSYSDTGGSSPNGITAVPSYINCMVTYDYAQSDRFEPQLFTDIDDLEDFYGAATNASTGNISCRLAFAAQKASDNGCDYILAVGVSQGAGLSSWQDALELLKGESNYEVIVPLYFNTTFFGNCSSFISDMQSFGVFPFFVLGGTSSQNIDNIRNAATSLDSEDIVMFSYPTVEHYNDVTNSTYDINGYYAAAAVAGKMLSQQIYEPLTKKTISGIYAVPKISPESQDYYTTQGLFMTHNRNGAVKVRHGVTTNPDSSATKEISVVRAKHYMLEDLMSALNSVVVGSALDSMTVVSAKGVARGRLNSMIDSRVISAYTELKARLNPTEPTRLDIKFKYRPCWPINYVVIQFSIDSTTGDVTSVA